MDKPSLGLRLRRVIASSLFPLLFLSPLFAAELTPVTVDDYSPGLSTKEDPSKICDGCAQDLLNVDVENKTVEKRRGSVKQNSTVLGSFTAQPTKIIGEFVDSNANSWMLSVSSNSLYKSNDSGATNTLLTSTFGITSLSQFCQVNAFGKTRLTDGTTNWILFDGSNLTVSTASPKGLTCEFFAERVWTSVGSLLQASANGVPEDWVTNSGTDDDAFSTYIRQTDGYSIRAIKRFKSGLLVFKDYSLDYLTLNPDGLTFSQRSISNRIGTQYPKTVVERENDVIWMASDGYYSYDGAVIKRISDPIQTTFFTIKQLSSGSRSYSETTQTSFTGGNLNQVSATALADSVVLSSYSATDTSNADFTLGTSSNTSVINNRVYLSTNDTNINNNGFESCTATVPANWHVTYSAGCSAGNPIRTGSFGGYLGTSGGGGGSYTYIVSDVFGTNLLSGGFSTSVGYGGQPQRVVSLAAYVGRWLHLEFRSSVGGNLTQLYTDDFLCSGGSISWYDRADTFPATFIFFDDVTLGRSTIYSGTFTSQAFNTTFSSAAWIPTTPSFQANGSSVTFQTQSSFDGSTWNTAAGWTPGSAPASVSNKYIRYIVTLSTGGTTNGTALPYVDDVTVAGRANNGRYLSTSIPTTSGTSWNSFIGNSDVSTGGSVTFEIYTDTDTVMVATNSATFISSQTVSNGALPTIAINAYAHVGSTFTITNSTFTPAMQDFTLSWNTGTSNFPVWSTYYQGSYFSAVAISSDTGNDRMLVYDKNGAWTIYSYPAYSLSLYRQQPYFGSNLQGDIVRFQADGVYQDYDGSAISAYWISREFTFGYPLTNKTINRYYVTAKYRATDTATFEWGADRGALTSEAPVGTLTLDATPGFFSKSIVPSSMTYKHGLSHRFKISNSVIGDRFDLLSVTIKADLETSP